MNYWMRKCKQLLPLLVVLFAGSLAQAQSTLSLQGVVQSEAGEALAGVSISGKDSATGQTFTIMSDEKGMFRIASLPVGNVYDFEFTHVGYNTYYLRSFKIMAGQNNSLLIRMAPADKSLDQVVVVGYGSQQRRFVTGSVAKVSGNELNDYSGSSFAQQLSGKAAGVLVSDASGLPGTDPKINIRGVGTLTAGTDPLIVVDGFPLTEGSSLNSINPQDIESMDILKDPASAAIYGSRAANGVLLISTKKGKNEKAKISLDIYTGFQQRADNLKLVDAYQAAKFLTAARDWGYVSKNPSNRSSSDDLATRISKGASLRERRLNYLQPYLDEQPGLTNTYWLDEIFEDAPMSNYNISVVGGNTNTNYYSSLNYFTQDGLALNTGLKRFSGTFKLNAKLSDKADFGFSFNPSYNMKKLIDNDGSFNDPISATVGATYPFFSPYNADGSLSISQQIAANTPEDGALVENPVAIALKLTNNRRAFRMFGNTYFSYKLLKNLTYKLLIGGDFTSVLHEKFNPSDVGWYRTPVASKQATAEETNMSSNNYLIEHTLTYAKKMGEHDVNVLAGYTFQKENGSATEVNGTNIPDNNIHNIAGAGSFAANSNKYRWVQISYLSRLQYIYKQRYITSFTFRSDGSSRFGANNYWATFPSVTTGWIFTKEDFFPQSGILTYGKLRATWGKSGNNQIGNYGSRALVRANTSPNSGYVFGNIPAIGFSAATTPNPNLSWETKVAYNIGLDLMLGRKLNFTAEYYNTDTKDLLLDVPVPFQSGFGISLQNIGSMRNNGFELSLSANKINIGEVQWDPNLNFSYNKNKVLSLAPGQTQIIAGSNSNIITKVGRPVAEIYGYQVTGVFKTEEQLANTPKLPGTLLGDYIVKDVNGDKVIDLQDWIPMGSYTPRFTYGFSNNFTWKNFNIGFSLIGIEGRTVHNITAASREESGEGFTIPSVHYYENYYDPNTNPDGTLAMPNFGNFSAARRSVRASNLFNMSGDYIRLRDAQIGYTFSPSFLKKASIKSARLYVSGNNLFTITKYRGFNPEGSPAAVLIGGQNNNNYPIARTYLIGCNITF